MARNFVVINLFKDLEDGDHLYKKGDFYPRHQKDVNDERLNALLSGNNAQKKPLIVEVLTYTPEEKEDVIVTDTKDKAEKEEVKKETKKKTTKK